MNTPLTSPETIANMKKLADKNKNGWFPYEGQIQVGRRVRSFAFFSPSDEKAMANLEEIRDREYRGCKIIAVFPL